MYTFELSKLTEFTTALVYQFEPEPGKKRMEGSESHIHDNLYVSVGQHRDILNGYLYAQNTILPEIRKRTIKAITAEEWQGWICDIHRLMAATLLETFALKSGEYCKNLVFRWHDCSSVLPVIKHWFSLPSSLPTDRSKALAEKVIQLVDGSTSNGANEYIDFIKVGHKIEEREDIAISSNQKEILREIPASTKKCIHIFCKMQTAYHSGLLSDSDKKIIDKIGIISLPPERLREEMRQFTENLVGKLVKLEVSDQKKVAKLVAKVYSRFTKIHPFANVNGRTANCIANIILRSLGLPSIILRLNGEKKDKSCLYHKAVQNIDRDITPLAKLIEQRIKESSEHGFCDDTLRELIVLRVTLTQLCMTLEKKSPSTDLETLVPNFILEGEKITRRSSNYSFMDENATNIRNLRYTNSKLTALIQSLESSGYRKQAEKQPTQAQCSSGAAANKKQGDSLIDKARSITGIDEGWKYYPRQATLLLILKDEKRVREAARLLELEDSKTCKVSITKLQKDHSMHVCKVTDL